MKTIESNILKLNDKKFKNIENLNVEYHGIFDSDSNMDCRNK